MLNPRLAFIFGVPRSGTTLLSLLLDQHPSIHCPPEPWLLLGLDALGQVPPDHPADPPLLSGALAEFFGEDRASFLMGAAKSIYENALQRAGKTHFVDKTPRYYLCFDLLEKFFPECRGICLFRNPLDVAASYLTSWNVNLVEIIQNRTDSPFFLDYILGFRRLLEFSAKHPFRVLQYEALVSHPEDVMADIFGYLGVERSHISKTVNLEIAAQAFRGDRKILSSPTIHAKSINSYKHIFTANEIGVLLGALGRDAFVDLGYGNIWDYACSNFSLDTIDDDSLELTALAEKYLENRRASCQKAENNFFFNQRIEHLNAQNVALAQQVDLLNAQNVELAHQVKTLHDMGFRARAFSLFTYSKSSAKQFVRKAIWRIANGKPAVPLPRISLVTPVFNGEEYIAETLESVLRQDYPSLEYIIVDGGSTDSTLDIIRRYQDRDDFPQKISVVISGPDDGMYDAIAKGFERASGEIFCYLNADDLLECNGLRSVGAYFSKHPKVQVIYHEDVVLVDGWKYPNVRQPKSVDTVDLLNGHILFQDGVFWRREIYEAVGGFRRDLKLAGDFDFWLRMSAKASFVRRPHHVSCFRIRSGQLSTQMARYQDETRVSVLDFLGSMPGIRKFGWGMKKTIRQVRRKLEGKLKTDRLFFPIDFINMPPPVVRIPSGVEMIPRSPIDGMPAERLLFSLPDTRFGEQEINYIYLDSRHGIAITHPPITSEKLDGLYRKNYSNPPTEIGIPSGPSPYRGLDLRRMWEKILLMLPVEKLDRLFANAWGDTTLTQLTGVLKESEIDVTAPLRFLDAGCFEGHLLDQISSMTPWQAYGLEPNAQAVALAKDKGHLVWEGHAERAVETIPADMQFDVIFMGQSIEHLDDPVCVLRRLRLLLAPGGALVMSTPNLDSREIDHFGPTWAHWHPPYHRYIFSRKGLHSLVFQAGLMTTCFRSFSHPYWTTMSIAQNRLGLGGSVSHAVDFDSSLSVRARRYQFWKVLFWDRIGKGDYSFIAAKDGSRD